VSGNTRVITRATTNATVVAADCRTPCVSSVSRRFRSRPITAAMRVSTSELTAIVPM
jgi:hypothetical protein